MSKLKNSYWLETDQFFSNNNSNIHPETLSEVSKSATLVLKTSPKVNFFCNIPTPLYTTQFFDFSITYKKGFNMHTGKRNPLQVPEDQHFDTVSTELISGKLFHTQNILLFLF